MMNKALIHIDYTNDFVADEGLLTSGEAGQALHDRLLELTKEFQKNKDFIVFAIDVHEQDDPYHPETELFPPHNLRDSWGRDLYGEMEDYYQSIRDEKNVYYMDKTRYSAFAGTELELKLREREIEEVHLVGVVTDICILHTAIDAYNKGFKIVVHEDGVGSFNQAGHEWALSHFKGSLGAEVVKK